MTGDCGIGHIVGDRYELLARKAPAFLLVLPIALSALAFFPALQAWWATLLSLLAACGVAYLLGQLAQHAGKTIEPVLHKRWGVCHRR